MHDLFKTMKAKAVVWSQARLARNLLLLLLFCAVIAVTQQGLAGCIDPYFDIDKTVEARKVWHGRFDFLHCDGCVPMPDQTKYLTMTRSVVKSYTLTGGTTYCDSGDGNGNKVHDFSVQYDRTLSKSCTVARLTGVRTLTCTNTESIVVTLDGVETSWDDMDSVDLAFVGLVMNAPMSSPASDWTASSQHMATDTLMEMIITCGQLSYPGSENCTPAELATYVINGLDAGTPTNPDANTAHLDFSGYRMFNSEPVYPYDPIPTAPYSGYAHATCSLGDDGAVLTVDIYDTGDATTVNDWQVIGGIVHENLHSAGRGAYSVHSHTEAKLQLSNPYYTVTDVESDASGMLSSPASETNSFVKYDEVDSPVSPDQGYTSCDWTDPNADIYYGSIYGTSGTTKDRASKNQDTNGVSLTKLRYHFGFETDTNVSYTITRHFTVLTGMNCSTNAPYIPEKKKATTITGTGQMYWETNDIIPTGGPIEFQLKYKDDHGNDATETLVTDVADNIWVAVKVTVEPFIGGCSACSGGGGGPPGSVTSGLKSVELNFDLGRMAQGQSVGALNISEQTPSGSLYAPASLNLLAAPENVTPIYASGMLRQVGAAQCLVDILTPSPGQGYKMVFYAANALIAGHDTNTLISTNGLPVIVTWTVENPDTAATNRLQVIETKDGQSITNIYSWNMTNNNQTWALVSGNGLREEVLKKMWNGDQTVRTETRQIFSPANTNQVLYQKVEQYQVFDWGEALVMDVTGTGNAALTNTYSYYGDGNPEPYQVTTSDGGTWTYSYDSHRRKSFVTSTFEDGGGSANVTYYYYSDTSEGNLSSYGDNTNFWPLRPRYISEANPNSSDGVKSTYFIALNANTNITCMVPGYGASPFAAGSLCTTNHYYPAGDPNATKLKSVENPDGTMALYYYASGPIYQTNTMLSGQPNSGHTDIVDGTKTITVLGSVGEVVLRQVYDVPSGVLTAQESYTYTDVLKRSYKVRFLDGTTNTVQYNCCGVGTTIDRDGVTTYYSYDDLKRQTAALQNEFSITTATTFDAVGNVRATKRIAGSTITLQQTAYDDAGRVRFQTNALNGVTSYAYSMDGSGHRVTTMTNSDGGTRIETYYLDGTLYQITGTAVHPVRYDYYGGTTETKLDTDGNPTSEWVKTFTDGLGRQTETQYADYSSSHSYYNGQGQLTNQVDPDSVMTLYQYNGKGELALTAINLNRDGNIDYNGDRITSTVSDVVTNHSVNVRRTRTYVWDTFGSDSSNLVSTIETSTDGLKSWQTVYRDDSTPVITSRESTTGSSRTTTAVAPDNSYTISVYSYGRLASVTRYDASPSQIGKTTYGYDAHGRQYTIADVRNGTTTYGYNNADQVISVTTPAPGTGGSAQTTTAAYNPMLQATNVVQPDGTSVTSEYALSGELKKTYGSRTYPVEYTFDYAGRMKTMKTWQDYTGNSGTATNTWNYDIYRGFLTSKTYQGGVSGPTYTYTSAGRLASRIWARGITTAYGYDNAGGLGTITYDDGITPNVVNNYDRLGRLSTNVCNDITTTFAYNTANELLSESYSGGILAGLAVTNSYDAYLRRMAVALNTQPSTLNQFGYDGASRLAGVTNGNYNATYAYLANSPLVSQITFKSNSVTRMTTSKQYDYLNRLTAISSSSSSPSSSFSYQYNNANQRTRATLVDGSYWIYTYDSLGQVTGGNRYWADGTPVAGQQFDYSFDDIGNRKQTLAGGDAVGSSLRLANYTNNLLNQITSRDVPGYVDIMGVSIATNTVTVNGTNAYRKGEYFRKELPTDNSSAALWTNIIVTATGQSSVTGNVLLAKSLEAFTYDGDGNLTSDGLWTNTWNAENRLIASECRVGVPTAGRMKEEWTYLPDGRWTQRIVSTNNGSGWVAVLTNRFVWDNKVLLAILDQTNGVDMSFVRGLDLSGKMQRAGGVGGLLAINFKTSGTHFAAFDGNANVAALVSGVDGTASANYEYDPFGQTLRITGTMGKLNPIRYSTQFADDVRGIVKYPYREYIPTIGGWNSRDPIAEKGGINLYCFVGNNPVNSIDPFGFATIFALPAEVIAEYEAGISIEQIAEDYGLVIEQVLQLIAGYEISKQVNEIIKNAQRLAKGKDPCELAKSALRQVRNGIESYEKVIQEHQGWINDPSSYPGGLNPDPANPQRAIDKWLKDIARAEGNIEKSKQAIKILEKLVDAACKCWYKPWTWFR